MKCVTGIFLGLAALALTSTQIHAEGENELTRERVALVAPPLVHAHEQATKAKPKIVEFTLTVVEKPVVIDEAGTIIPASTFNGSMPGPLMSFTKAISLK